MSRSKWNCIVITEQAYWSFIAVSSKLPETYLKYLRVQYTWLKNVIVFNIVHNYLMSRRKNSTEKLRTFRISDVPNHTQTFFSRKIVWELWKTVEQFWKLCFSFHQSKRRSQYYMTENWIVWNMYHKTFTHEYLFKKKLHYYAYDCNTTMNVQHIISECSALKKYRN